MGVQAAGQKAGAVDFRSDTMRVCWIQGTSWQ